MEIKVRKASINDLNLIQSLNNKLFEYEMERKLDEYVQGWAFGKASKAYFMDLIENQLIIIAEIGSKPVGYLAGSVYQDDTYSYYNGKTAELENMFVEEEFRRLGIGSKLVNSFVEWAKQQNAKRIFVTATVGNDKTIAFYRRKGFSELNIQLKMNL